MATQSDPTKETGSHAERALLAVSIVVGLCIIPSYVYTGSTLCKTEPVDENLNFTFVPKYGDYKEKYTATKDGKAHEQNISSAFPFPYFIIPYAVEQRKPPKSMMVKNRAGLINFFVIPKYPTHFSLFSLTLSLSPPCGWS